MSARAKLRNDLRQCIEYEAVQATKNVGVRAVALAIGTTKATRNALDDAMTALEATRQKAAGRGAGDDQNVLEDAMVALKATRAAGREAEADQNALDDAMAALEATRQKAAE